MSDTPNDTGTGVPPGVNRAGDATPASPAWVERSIWTDRMLSALGNGVQGGKWHSLIDKIGSVRALDAAWQQVRRNRGARGVDGVTIGQYDRAYRRLHPKLAARIRSGGYQVLPVRRVWIPKPGSPAERRPLGIPTVLDRVVQQAARLVLEPIFEHRFHDHSYGFRPGRRAQDALHHVARTLGDGHTWIVDADLKSFFDTIDHDLLLEQVGQEVSDGAVHRLLRQFLEAGVMEADIPDVRASTTGTPQGGVISPLLANIYLNDLDHVVHDAGHIMVRYADDFIILCRSEAEARAALALVRGWVTKRRLTLHPEKTQVVAMDSLGSSFDFLGFTFKRSQDRWTGKPRILRLPCSKSVANLRAVVRQETRRCNGRSLAEIISRLNARLRGWGTYFRSVTPNALQREDQWIRMRLRSILRKRRKRKGRGRGRDHNRWPNAFFAERGLVSLASLHIRQLSP